MPSKQPEAGQPARPQSLPPRARMKASDLPLSSAVRNSIDGIVHTFKKQGNYDEIRKQVMQSFTDGGFQDGLEKSIIESVKKELEKNQSLLGMDTSKAIVLLEGAITRTTIYPDAEESIRKLLDGHRGEMEKGLRVIRAKEIGEEAAMKEQIAGSKSDEEYSKELAIKRKARDAEKKKKMEEEKEALNLQFEKTQAMLTEEKRKFKESKLAREAEQQQRLAARYRSSDDHHERRSSRFDNSSRRDSSTKDISRHNLPKELISEVKIDDDIALRAILTDTKEPSSRSRQQLALEIDETLAPPPRKPKHISAINTSARDSPIPIKNLEAKKDVKTEVTPDLATPILNAPKGPKADIRINLGKSLAFGEKKKSGSPERAHREESKDRDSTKHDDKKSTDHRKIGRQDSKDDRRDDGHRESRRDSRARSPREKDRDDRSKRDHRDEERRLSRKHSRSPSPVYRSTRRRERSPTPTYHSLRKHSRSRSRSRNRDRERRSSHRSRSRESAQHGLDYRRKRSLSRPRPFARVSVLLDPTDREAEAKLYMEEQRLRKEKEDLALTRKAEDPAVVRKADHFAPKDRSRRESDAYETSPKSTRKRDGSKDRSTKREDRVRGRSRSRSLEMPPPSARKESHTDSVEIVPDRYTSSRHHREGSEPRVSSRRPESIRSARSRERTPPRRISRIERSSSPPNIDRYVPGGGTSRKDRRPRSKDRDRRDRSRSRDRYDRRDRSRDRDRRDRSRSRDRRDRSRDRDRDKYRDRSRSRSRDRDRERERDRARDRDRDRDRERTSKRRRSPAYSRSRSREKRRERSKDRGDRERRRDSDRRD